MNLYDNVGRKIKNFAIVIFVIGAIYSIARVLDYITSGNNILWAVFIFVAGVAIAWIASLFIYAFGELICEVYEINNNLYDIKNNLEKRPAGTIVSANTKNE